MFNGNGNEARFVKRVTSIVLRLLPYPLTLNDTGFLTLTKNRFIKPPICVDSTKLKINVCQQQKH